MEMMTSIMASSHLSTPLGILNSTSLTFQIRYTQCKYQGNNLLCLLERQNSFSWAGKNPVQLMRLHMSVHQPFIVFVCFLSTLDTRSSIVNREWSIPTDVSIRSIL